MTEWNAVLTRVFDVLLAPFGRWPPMAGLEVLSLATAVGVLYVFKWTANRSALVRSKRAMQAAVFEMRLFNDDLLALARAQRDVLRHTLGYLRASLAPTLWLAIPLALLMIHVHFHFGYTGFRVGEAALLTLRLADDSPALAGGGADGRVGLTLEAPHGVRVETPAVVLPSAREVTWRLRPDATGYYQLIVRFGNSAIPVSFVASDRVGRRVPLRPRAGSLDQLLNPSEPPVEGGPLGVSALTLDYPEREVLVGGWNVGWAGVYLVLTLLFAFVLKRPLGVEL